MVTFFSKWWRNWHYKNTTFLAITFILFLFLADSGIAKFIVACMANLGYLGAFITGIFFVFIFTAVPAGVLLFHLADILNPFLIAVFAGVGAMMGDYLILRFLRDKVFDELRPLVPKPGKIIIRLFCTPYFAWILPLMGAIIIASPLPDEVGISLMGLSHIKSWQFILISFLLNSVGILTVIFIARLF